MGYLGIYDSVENHRTHKTRGITKTLPSIRILKPSVLKKEMVGDIFDFVEQARMFILAHELGHHFSYRKQRPDYSERAADKYIKILFKKYTPKMGSANSPF
jgi:nucleoside diphosphate kinase